MAITKIKIKRGLSTNFNTVLLDEGELAYLTDTNQLYIGVVGGKALLNSFPLIPGINTTDFYPSVMVNEYGQVTNQKFLAVSDIPVIPTTKVSGLGSASLKNTGILADTVPLIGADGKLPSSIISYPQTQTYFGIGTAVDKVPAGAIFKIVTLSSTGTAITMDTNGLISLNVAGTYLINYNVSSSTTPLVTCLSNSVGTGDWAGSFSSNNAVAVNTLTKTGASIIRNTTAIEKLAIRNVGATPVTPLSSQVSITIVKIS